MNVTDQAFCDLFNRLFVHFEVTKKEEWPQMNTSINERRIRRSFGCGWEEGDGRCIQVSAQVESIGQISPWWISNLGCSYLVCPSYQAKTYRAIAPWCALGRALYRSPNSIIFVKPTDIRCFGSYYCLVCFYHGTVYNHDLPFCYSLRCIECLLDFVSSTYIQWLIRQIFTRDIASCVNGAIVELHLDTVPR